MLERPIAVFSDVHANFEALEAVLADMDAHALSTRVCLGDTVGYGPDPEACLKRVIGLGCPILRGNHDDAVGSDEELDDMGGLARFGIRFTRKVLPEDLRAYLRDLPLTHEADGAIFVHASLDVPDHWEYVLSPWDAASHFEAQTHRICFCGHTHLPMVWHLSDEGDIACWPGRGRINLPETGKILVNVGSVGQPRDNNPAACYAVCGRHAHWVEFRRVEYDVATTGRKIRAAGLPPFAAERLTLGK